MYNVYESLVPVYWISNISDKNRLQNYKIYTAEVRHSHERSNDLCVSRFE